MHLDKKCIRLVAWKTVTSTFNQYFTNPIINLSFTQKKIIMKSKFLLFFLASIISGLVYGKSPSNGNLPASGSKAIEASANTGYFAKSLMKLPPISWTEVENNDPGWAYLNFEEDVCTTCSGGSAHSYEFENATAEYTFSGTDLEVYAETWDGAGSIEVFVDGVSKGIFTQKVQPYTGATRFAAVSGLSSGSHQLKLVSVPEEGTGYINWVGIDFIRFGYANAMPLTLVSFNGKATNSANALSWETKDEVNVKNFEIERSADGVQFKQIAVVNSKGGGIYGTEDRTPPSGNNYYRLKMVDNDGIFALSKTILIKDILRQGIGFTIYPNPIKDKVTISPTDKSSLVKVTLFDLRGKKIFAKQIVGTTEISLGNLTKGVYIIQLINKGEISTLKLFKD